MTMTSSPETTLEREQPRLAPSKRPVRILQHFETPPSVQLPQPGRELRSRVRAAAGVPVSVRYAGIYELPGQAINLSAQGMFFAVRKRIAPQTPVELVFRLPDSVVQADSVWLRCQAEVVRVDPLPEGKFGVAAHLTSYDVFRPA